MQAILKTFILPPHFEDDPEQTQSASLLNTVLLMLAFGLLIGVIPALFDLTQNRVNFVLFISGFGLLGLMRLLMLRGYVRLTSWLLVISAWVLVSSSTTQWEGVNSPGMYYLLTVVLFSGLLLGRRAVLGIGLASVLWLVLIYFLGVNGNLPPAIEPVTPETTTAVLISNIITGTMILFVAIGLVKRAEQVQRQKEQELQHTLTDLQETAVSRDYVDNVLRSMSNMLVVVDRRHRIKTVNPSTLELLGYDESDLLGKPFELICPPELNDLDDPRSDTITRQNLEMVYRTRDGQAVPVALVRSLMRDKAGSINGVIYVAQDITERKRAEVERHQAEAERQLNTLRYRALFEQTNDAVFLLDTNGKHITCNQRAADMLGYSPPELHTMNYLEIVAPQHQDAASGVLSRLLQGEHVPTYERIFRRKDGSTFPVEINVELVHDPTGKPLHIQSIVRDITERKETMRQMQYHADLVEHVTDAIISTDHENRIKTWNHAAEAIYGWTAHEVIGRPLNEIFPDQPGGEDLIKQRYMERGYWTTEQVHFHRDGQKLHILSSVSLLRNGSSGFSGLVLVNHNFTLYKQAQEYLEALITQLFKLRQVDAQVNSTLDIEEVVHYVLEAAYQLSGADAGFILLHDGDQMRMAQAMGSYADIHNEPESGSEVYGLVRRAIDKRESLFFPDVSIEPDYVSNLPDTQAQIVIPLMDKRDRLVGVINLETSQAANFNQGVFNFLNLLASRLATALEHARVFRQEQRRAEQLETLFARVDSLEKIKTEAIYIASHDLRAPLGVLISYLAMLLEDTKLRPEHQEYVTEMRKSVDQMSDIIMRILSLERIHELSENGLTDSVDLSELSTRVVTSLRRQSQVKLQKMQVSIPVEPVCVLGEYMLLHQAAYNLVQNAIKYTPEHGQITVNLTVTGDCVTFLVTDTGYGIPEDQQDRLFSPGFRVSSSENDNIDGTGMGLWLVKKQVERHKGELIFHSTHGKGSTFGFKLPLAH